MTMFTLAAAQSRSVAGDIQANLSRHLRFMRAAAEQRVRLLVFPELSLTGYELELARELAIPLDDERLRPLRDLAWQTGMTVVVGAPVRQGQGVLIGALVLGGDGSLGLYGKQHLHGDETRVFTPGNGGTPLVMNGKQIALAICADFTQASHPRHAAQAGATVYAASVLISVKGYAADSQLLAGHAAEHGMAVLMANHGGETGGWQSAGRSAFWDESGMLVAAAPGDGELLLVARRQAEGWSGTVIAVE